MNELTTPQNNYLFEVGVYISKDKDIHQTQILYKNKKLAPNKF